ncbi:MAG: hypothetical protein AB1832_11405 [Pseudomonadota bacterium]|jgi:hypothetical protein
MTDADLASLREAARMALTQGLQTRWQERAYEDADVRKTVAALQAIAPDRLDDRLRAAGLTLTPFVGSEDPGIEQSCRTCMYYEPHRRYCNLPELKLGVEPEWSCVLWRV